MMQVCIICTGWFGRCRAFDNNCPLLGTKSWPVKVQFKGAWFFLFYNQVRVTFLSKPENITRKPSWTVILPSLPRYIILAPRCDITYGRDKWILLMSAHGRQRKYSTAATANVSKQKEKKDWLTQLFVTALLALTLMVMVMRRREVDDDEAQAECEILCAPRALQETAPFLPSHRKSIQTSVAVCLCPTDTAVVTASGLLL